MKKAKVAILGSGNIGTDLMMKILRHGKNMEAAALAGIDPSSEGLARAKRLGLQTTAEGMNGLRRLPCYADIEMVFDATSARTHYEHAKFLARDGKRAIDLTPAAVGPYVVPTVNLDEHLASDNLNMVTCGGQATIPIVAAVSRIAPVLYAEIVASIASKSAGLGTRANIDEFTETTARGLEVVGRARRGKAIIILNPAEPPMLMRDTVYCLVETDNEDAVERSVTEMVRQVQTFVPGYRLKQAMQFEKVTEDSPWRVSGHEPAFEASGAALKVTVFLEVEGAAHYLPKYAGNLDIMTAAALRTGERVVDMALRVAV